MFAGLLALLLRAGSFALLSAPATPIRSPQAPEALALMKQAVAQLERHVNGKTLAWLHNEDLVVQAGFTALLQQSRYVTGAQQQQFNAELTLSLLLRNEA